jgi:F-type H+-transporting ATPase subunit a
MQPHISLAAEQLGNIFGLPFTNSTLMTWVVIGMLLAFAYFATRNLSFIPSPIQSIAEMIIEALFSLFESVVGKDHIRAFFPLLATIFLFVMISNWSGLLPGVGSIGFTKSESEQKETLIQGAYATTVKDATLPTDKLPIKETVTTEKSQTHSKSEFVPLFRGPTADLNTTLALALIAVGALQYFGFKSLGLGYLKKFLNFSNPINFFLGILELISEAAKIISFAFRLFGNIFAGEVLLTVIAFLMPVIAPLPFIGLELFVGVIQALVFSMLTAVFLNMATMAHAEH